MLLKEQLAGSVGEVLEVVAEVPGRRLEEVAVAVGEGEPLLVAGVGFLRVGRAFEAGGVVHEEVYLEEPAQTGIWRLPAALKGGLECPERDGGGDGQSTPLKS